MSRYAFAKKDGNHNELSEAFEKLGYSVLDLSRMGDDCLDILIGKANVSCLVEIKSDGGKLTRGQLDFIAGWRGRCEVARSVDDVIAIDRRLMA